MGNPVGAPHILPKHLYGGSDWKKNPYNDRLIGTGPFMFKERVKGDYIELSKNPHYFRRGKESKPYIDRIVFRIMPDSASRLMAIRKGDIDFIYTYAVPFDEIAALRRDPGLIVDKRGNEALGVLEFLIFNLRQPVLSNRLVRQAISHAIDKTQIQDLVLAGEGRPGTSVIHSGITWAHNSKTAQYTFDLKKANDLLDKAGYPRKGDGTRFKLRLFWNVGLPWEGMAAEVIRDQLRRVGIDAQVTSLDRAAVLDKVFMKWDFDMLLQLLATGPEPTVNATRFLHTKQIKKAAYVNAMGYSNAEVDKLLDIEFTQIDRMQRSPTWHRSQDVVMNDLPLLPIWEQPIANTYRGSWTDVITGPYGVYQSREHSYIRKQ